MNNLEASALLWPILFGGGLLAGTVNAVAGGGTLVTFPIFLASGLPPISANASNAVAVWPGHALAVVEYRKVIQETGFGLLWAVIAAIAGGMSGAFLLGKVGNGTFLQLIPFLLLTATTLFAFGPSINRWLSSPARGHRGEARRPGAILGVFAFSVYGGFFGAGLGVMLMAGLLLLGVRDPQHNNALKNLLATVVTSISALVLAASGLVSWPHTMCAFAGAIIGGMIGGRFARALPAQWLRKSVIMVGYSLAAYYFHKYCVHLSL